VQDLFLTETAMLADIVLPAAAAYEKNGTMTNTAGEVQLVRKGGDVMGTRSDFDILRILSHQLAKHGSGKRSPAHSRSCLRRNPEVRGRIRRLPATLLLGESERTLPVSTANGNANLTSRLAPFFPRTIRCSPAAASAVIAHDPLPSEAAAEVEVEARP